jgi:hypothetical protein
MNGTYLVESYWPGVCSAEVEAIGARLVGDLKVRGEAKWLHSILIPEDEIILSVFDGSSSAGIIAAAARAALPTDRIIECVRVAPGSARPLNYVKET